MKIITEGNKPSRLRHYIGAPKRILRRARDFYVDTMVNFDGKVSTSANLFACPAVHASHLPTSFGGQSQSPSKVHDSNDNLKQLFRSISDKYSWDSREYDEYQGQGRGVSGYSAMDRSYSVAVGRMGRIDEDEPCEFQESVIIKKQKPSCAGYRYNE